PSPPAVRHEAGLQAGTAPVQPRKDATMTNVAPDALGGLLIDKGFAPSDFVLDLNRSLTVPHNMALPAPWNLPSRLFRFPIEVSEARGKGRRIGLMHPLLGEHPFVQLVAAELGAALDPNGAPNAYGYSKQRTALWWHAVDLISAGKWRELLETRRFTTDYDIAGAVVYGLDFSPHDAEARCGYISITEARQIMRAIGSVEPGDRAAILHSFSAPNICRQESGKEHWPINSAGALDVESRAWGRILGIEAGWFKHDRAGFLTWTEAGRDRYAAGEAATFTERKTGQVAFAF
ncbi:hypothetical protein, partial [Xanthomonas hortorum]|uniref:hypothetical protein n=1 Tax=Xanthomonas hortorum TaxID=56454 RepID=UPI002FE33F3A